MKTSHIVILILAVVIMVMVLMAGGCKKDDEPVASNLVLDPNWTLVFDSDSTLIITLEPITYEPKERLKEVCWVRALTKLEQIYEDPNIIDAYMIAGWCNSEWGFRYGHAWIEYTIRDNNEIKTIRYDPTKDVYLEPHPNDANLLIPVIPKEPNDGGEPNEPPNRTYDFIYLNEEVDGCTWHFPTIEPNEMVLLTITNKSDGGLALELRPTKGVEPYEVEWVEPNEPAEPNEALKGKDNVLHNR